MLVRHVTSVISSFLVRGFKSRLSFLTLSSGARTHRRHASGLTHSEVSASTGNTPTVRAQLQSVHASYETD